MDEYLIGKLREAIKGISQTDARIAMVSVQATLNLCRLKKGPSDLQATLTRILTSYQEGVSVKVSLMESMTLEAYVVKINDKSICWLQTEVEANTAPIILLQDPLLEPVFA